MASEIRVNKITHTAGVGTITTSADGVVIAGIVTENNYSGNVTGNVTGAVTGSGANLTSIPAGQLTGTVADARISTLTSSKLSGALPALDGSALTGVGASFGNSSVNTSGIITATAFVPTTGQLSHRNIIINGDMRIAQRGTSSTTNGYRTIDRITPYTDNIGVTATYSQVDVTSGGAYDSGFRKAWQVTKGAGTANTNSQVNMGYKIEAQDIANSGWKYTDPNSFITFSFWVKTSVSNHNPQVLIQNSDTGTSSTKFFVIDVPTLTANTWTKITQTIPGHANQVYNNDNGNGFEFQIIPWYGTDYTDAGNTTGAWTSFGTKPVNTTWLTTNGSTFQITGVQLEVGPVATPFEHRSQTEELNRCKRYFQKFAAYSDHYFFGISRAEGGSIARTGINIPIPMRSQPTVACPSNRAFKNGTNYTSTSTPSILAASNWISEAAMYTIDFGGHSGLSHNNIYLLMSGATATLGLTLDSEL